VQVNIAARHGQLSPATQAKITEKAEKLQKYFDRVSAINVTVDLEHRDNHHDAIKVELQVSAERTEDFVAAEVAAELFMALDSAVHKVEQQIKKYKEKRIDGHRQPGRKTFESP
jgi:putative sigma-54 modulation protein